ncbi:MAG: ribosome maturation factor RimM [Candidatus Manganitrophaceae bacterium]
MITIGRVLKSVGLRGELKISPLTDFPERFDSLEEVLIETKEGQTDLYRIEGVRHGPPFVYLHLAGLTSVEMAQSLAGGVLLIPDEKRIPLPKGSYYHFEIEGLDVYLEDGVFLGKVDEIIRTGSNDVYVVRQGGKEYLIPALVSVVRKISLSEGKMVISPMNGLLERP